jgi:hypothetical protein
LACTGEQWAIELMRESNRLEEYCNKFQPGDSYCSAVTSDAIEKFICILNFTICIPRSCSFGIDRMQHCLYIGLLLTSWLGEPGARFHVVFRKEFWQFDIVERCYGESCSVGKSTVASRESCKKQLMPVYSSSLPVLCRT